VKIYHLYLNNFINNLNNWIVVVAVKFFENIKLKILWQISKHSGFLNKFFNN